MAAPLILIVDDDYHITEMLEAFLVSSGFRTVVAYDGDQALKALAQETPALVLLDLLLPKVDGFAILDTMRNNPKTRAIPVFVISGRDMVADVDTAFTKGASEFLIKPLHMDRLMAKIRKHLNLPAPGGH